MKQIANLKKLFFSNSKFTKKSLVLMLLLPVLLMSQTAFSQNSSITGRISGADGAPVQGASVIVKGSSVGTSTDESGNFSISAAPNSTLVISAVDFITQEIRVGNRTTLAITLVTSNRDLSEVIVVGYGTQRKEAVTGSVASIGGDKLRDVPSPNITQALQGRLAGVDISQTSTRPGATMQIRIRGVRSLLAENGPLIVLDGIPFIGSLADINPNDIKSVDVLKDASATAIYGSRGANGVIMVTTEKGSKNRKPRISYNGYHGVQTIFSKYPMMNGPQFVAYRKAANSTPRAQRYTNGQDEADSINTDWQDLLYRTGFVTDHNISISGGTETGSYNFGGGYHFNQGIIPTQEYKRYSFRASMDQQVGKLFRVGFTTNNNYNQSEGSQVGISGALSMTPISSPYNADGTKKRYIRMAVDNFFIFTKDVVETLKDNGQWLNDTRGYATYNAVYGEVKAPFLDGLKYRINLGLDYVQSNNGAYTGPGVGDALNPNTVSSASVDNRQSYHWTVENILSYDQTFGKHTINAVALYSAEERKIIRTNMSATDIPSDALQYYNLGQAVGQLTIDPALQDYRLSGLMSGMGRVMYSYDNRYMISATLRSDASSRLAPGNKWHTYPAVSLGWNITKESFMQGTPVINNLKLRAGYGITSNQGIDEYSTLGQLVSRPYNFGPTGYAVGFAVNQLQNDKLGWEFSKTFNVGLDFALLKNRLSGSVEYYVTKTEDVLLNLSLPSTSGVTSITSNIGTTENKGFELGLNGTIINDRNGWTWEMGVNFYTNKNKLTSLASGQSKDELNWFFVGHNINSIYDYKKIGIWNSDKDSTDGFLNVLEPTGNVGMIKVLYTGGYDANGRPLRAIGVDDRQVIDMDPDWQGGFNTRVAYKGFDLGVVGMYRHGGVLFSTIHGSNGYMNLLTGRRNNINVDYWTPENTDAKYPRPGGVVSGDNPRYGSTLSYFDGSYLKIRTITLGYDFNRSLMKNSDVKLRMYVTAQNPFVFFSPFHDESGMDPETNSYGNENASVNLSNNLRRFLTVGYNTPSTKNYIIGVNLTF